MTQNEIDARIQIYYAREFLEAERLTVRSGQGRLEFERVQELVASRIDPGSRILDIGGATGVHAERLTELGHKVILIDPVPEQVALARAQGSFHAEIGDARDLKFADDSFDAALMFGPLYHLAERGSRLVAIREAQRVVRRGGWVFAAAIPRFIAHAALFLGQETPHPYPADWIALLEHGTPPAGGRFPGAHFHTVEELQSELEEAGLVDVMVCAIEGPDGLALEELPRINDAQLQAAIMTARAVSEIPGIRDMSNHIMGIARVP